MTPNSTLSNILPLGQEKIFDNFRKIKIPILGIIGDTNECTVISPKKAVNKLRNENNKAECYIIENCNHSYEDKEHELIAIIKRFLEKHQLAISTS